MAPLYKVVELSTVSDDEIERVLNERTAEGWVFDSLHFAMRESSRRPAMAFLTFTRDDAFKTVTRDDASQPSTRDHASRER